MANPVRIYVLHHPDSKLAGTLTNRIYDWFRLPSLDGIPVYVRSAAEAGKDRAPQLARQPGETCLEYIVPLVDAHMVRDPVWHAYVSDLAKQCVNGPEEQTPEWGWAMFPVALDSTAFNMPEMVTRMNFIRYGTSPAPKPAAPDKPTEAENAALDAYHAGETEELLKHLTEALARDLTWRLFEQQQPEGVAGSARDSGSQRAAPPKAERFKIFISYARADSTDEAKALRNYIQSQTQCLVFFDENDIGFGQAFDESIAKNVGEHSKALIVLNSDQYAERPWCRWEIKRFTQPRAVPLTPGGDVQNGPHVQVFHPLLVVDNLKGPQMTRIVPELAQAPTVRWEPGRERLCFSTLMREVVMGLRDVLETRTMQWGELSNAVVVNRLPGPVGLMRLLPGGTGATGDQPFTVHHPGHGLPLTELRLLEQAFSNVRFQAFRDVTRQLPDQMAAIFAEMEKGCVANPPLRDKVIAISTAHNPADLAALGFLPQHQDEALIHLLRPLLRLGADLLFGGKPPKRDMESQAAKSALADRNITLTLMQLLSSERCVGEIVVSPGARPEPPPPGPLLFNISAWPACDKITATDEAAWIKACRVYRVTPRDANLPDWTEAVPGENEPPTPRFRRHLALTLSRMRELLADGFCCKVPGNLSRQVRPAAFVFIGGVLDKFKGVMPGVVEEFLSATQARPAIPIYLIGGLGGATGMIAQALLNQAAKHPPKELTLEHYASAPAPNHAEYQALMAELDKPEAAKVREQFRTLWSEIKARHGQAGLDNLFANGLNHDENRQLLATPSTTEAVSLIWQGMSRVFLSPARVAPGPKPRLAKKATPPHRPRGK